MKVPSNTGLVSDINEDQNQHEDQKEKSSQIRLDADFSPEKTKIDLDKTKENAVAVEIPILNDEITAELTREDVESLYENPTKEDRLEFRDVWTASFF